MFDNTQAMKMALCILGCLTLFATGCDGDKTGNGSGEHASSPSDESASRSDGPTAADIDETDGPQNPSTEHRWLTERDAAGEIQLRNIAATHAMYLIADAADRNLIIATSSPDQTISGNWSTDDVDEALEQIADAGGLDIDYFDIGDGEDFLIVGPTSIVEHDIDPLAPVEVGDDSENRPVTLSLFETSMGGVLRFLEIELNERDFDFQLDLSEEMFHRAPAIRIVAQSVPISPLANALMAVTGVVFETAEDQLSISGFESSFLDRDFPRSCATAMFSADDQALEEREVMLLDGSIDEYHLAGITSGDPMVSIVADEVSTSCQIPIFDREYQLPTVGFLTSPDDTTQRLWEADELDVHEQTLTLQNTYTQTGAKLIESNEEIVLRFPEDN